jgi:hypothetical protein
MFQQGLNLERIPRVDRWSRRLATISGALTTADAGRNAAVVIRKWRSARQPHKQGAIRCTVDFCKA